MQLTNFLTIVFIIGFVCRAFLFAKITEIEHNESLRKIHDISAGIHEHTSEFHANLIQTSGADVIILYSTDSTTPHLYLVGIRDFRHYHHLHHMHTT